MREIYMCLKYIEEIYKKKIWINKKRGKNK